MYRPFFIFLVFTLTKEAFAKKYVNCRRDYSITCAEGWSKLISRDECEAPLSYTGPCSRFLQVDHDTKNKKLLEQECNISWPCTISCEQDYSVQCPSQWTPADEKLCIPSAMYNGTCLLPHDFSIMTNEQKIMWGNKCDVTWPCKEACKKDYSKGCPKEWLRDENGLCTAPKHYNGPCLPKASLFSLDTEMKVAFEKLCRLDFPCKRKCAIDEQDICPKHWILQSDEVGNPVGCLPPDNYSGHCDRTTKFFNLNEELKDQKSYECDIEWSCVSDADELIDYDQLCPEGWTQEQEYCIAPQQYTGPCPRKKLFDSFSIELKKEYGELCNIKWPLLVHRKPDSFPKSSALRKGKNNFGAVEPDTGEIISLI